VNCGTVVFQADNAERHDGLLTHLIFLLEDLKQIEEFFLSWFLKEGVYSNKPQSLEKLKINI
jgi:hypothetical protein